MTEECHKVSRSIWVRYACLVVPVELPSSNGEQSEAQEGIESYFLEAILMEAGPTEVLFPAPQREETQGYVHGTVG
jgi:ABC-type phosphate transport system ATPase subunit